MEMRTGYKQSEVGVIPADWEVRYAREIGEIKTGPFGTLLRAEEYSGRDGVPLISVGEVGLGIFRISDRTPLVPDCVVRRLPQYVLRTGDIVFGRKGAVDRSVLVSEFENGWFLGSDGMSIRPSKLCHPPYIACQFQRKEVQIWLLQNATGTTMASLNQEILSRVAIPYAPLPEQRAIAGVLGDVDALLGGLERLLAKKRDLKQAALQQLLTGQTRLPGFSGAWEVKRLGDVATFHKGKGLPKSALNVSGVESCIHYGELFTRYPETIGEIFSRTDSSVGIFRSIANDVLMPTSDVTPRGLAKASCVRADGVILGGDILVVRTDTELIFGSFLSYVIRYEEAQVLQLVTGSTVFHLYGSDMNKFTFSMPSLTEQTAIAAVLSDFDTEITALEARRDKTRDLKQAMMQELLTGRIRLL